MAILSIAYNLNKKYILDFLYGKVYLRANFFATVNIAIAGWRYAYPAYIEYALVV